MPPSPATKTLNKVMKGESSVKELSETAAKSALGGALTKLEKATAASDLTKENVGAGAKAALLALEGHGTVFLASMVEGYLGEDAMKVGGVDVRFGGLFIEGAGLVRCFMGKSDGVHLMALGAGLTTTALAGLGRQAGSAWKDSKAEKPADAAATPGPSSIQGEPAQVREIYMTPDPVPSTQGSRELVPARAL